MKQLNILKWSTTRLVVTNLILLIPSSIIFPIELFFVLLLAPYLGIGTETRDLHKATVISNASYYLGLDIEDCEVIEAKDVCYGKWGAEFGTIYTRVKVSDDDVLKQITASDDWSDLSVDMTMRKKLAEDDDIYEMLNKTHKQYGYYSTGEPLVTQFIINAIYDADTRELYMEIQYG